MTYSVRYTAQAQKSLRKMPLAHAQSIFRWIDDNLEGCANPRKAPTCKQLVGTRAGVRYRVGKYRILATIEDSALIIDVVRIAHRKDAYKNMPSHM